MIMFLRSISSFCLSVLQIFLQGACELVKFDMECHVQGDVVLECINLDDNMEYEEVMFRLMFNTAFIRSNVLMLNRDEIDTVWHTKEHFPEDFRAEVSIDPSPPKSCIPNYIF